MATTYQIWEVRDGEPIVCAETFDAKDKAKAERLAASWTMASDPGVTYDVVEVSE